MTTGKRVKAYTLNIARPVKRLKLAAPKVLEHPLHAQMARLLTLEIAPPGKVSKHGVVWWSCDIANFAGHAGARVDRGIVPGIPDIFILHRGRAHHPEVKRDDPKAGMSADQQQICAAILAAGGRVGVCWDAASLFACIDEWQIPRAHRIQEFG